MYNNELVRHNRNDKTKSSFLKFSFALHSAAQMREWRRRIMKKRIFATVMALTLGSAMLTACGSKDDVTTVEPVEASSVVEESSIVETTVVDENTEAATDETATDAAATDVAATEEAATDATTEEAATDATTEEAATDATTEEAATDTTTTEAAN